MIRRIAAPSLLALLAILSAVPAAADVLIVKGRRGEKKLLGIKSEINGVEVTAENLDRFIDQSTGEVVKDGYAAVEFKDRAKSKPSRYQRDKVIEVRYSTEPDALLDGFDAIATGNLGRALALFRSVAEDTSVREVFRIEATYRMALIYIQGNKHKTAIERLSKWTYAESVHTPEVHQRLAELYTRYRLYAKAREQYKTIEGLAEVTETWRYLGRLGGAQVDLAEHKYDAAEQTAKAVYGSVASSRDLANVAGLAAALQGQAILGAKVPERLAEAQSILQKAAEIEGMAPGYRAYLLATLGDVLYAQNKLEEARFPYMRVVCLYTDATAQVAHCLQNTGQIYIDLSGRLEGEAADKAFVKGMKLLAECAGRYKGTTAAADAARTFKKHKDRYEKLKG